MSGKELHTFKVWHPSQGGLPVYQEKVFGFTGPVSRLYARGVVEKIQGYVIEREQNDMRVRQCRVKNRVRKVEK